MKNIEWYEYWMEERIQGQGIKQKVTKQIKWSSIPVSQSQNKIQTDSTTQRKRDYDELKSTETGLLMTEVKWSNSAMNQKFVLVQMTINEHSFGNYKMKRIVKTVSISS